MAFNFIQTLSFLYLCVLLTFTASSSVISHDEECLALFQLKQNILPQDDATRGFRKLDSWRMITSNTSDNGSDCCFWDGVTCNYDGHVIELDLSKSFLRGRIDSNSTLFNLVHLQMLNLSTNQFSESYISSKIARLKQLKSLDISNSGFSGQIPNEISKLIHLSWLDLSWNSLKLQTPSLENLLQNFTTLEKLHLSQVEIRSSVPHFLANFSSLTSIDFEFCQLQDEFPTAILHLPKLKYLSVAQNYNLTGSLPEFGNNTLLEHLNLYGTGFAGIVPESIGNLKRLILLGLNDCHLEGRIPGSLSNLTQLTSLYLDRNEFIGQPPLLSSLVKLNVLGLGDNYFDKGGLPSGLSEHTNLKELYINNMNIYDEIPPYFANLTTLSVLSVARNFIFGSIPSSFMNLTQLKDISLQGNQLQGPISTAFSNFKRLKFLGLDGNNFSGEVDIETFVGLNTLKTLNLDDNRISLVTTNNCTNGSLPEFENLGLSSCNLKEFPSFLHFQNKLESLSLKNNKIGGEIPVWIWNNSQETMKLVDLSSNFITGFQQRSQFLSWVRLELFVIDYNALNGQPPIPPETTIVYTATSNNLTGEIPPLMCEVKSLRVLDLSSNNMIGTLPPCLGNKSNSMFVLDLKQNKFHGPMMNEFTQGNQLKKIDLSENRFVGEIPKSLANCTKLEILCLQDNSFEDTFPFWLQSLAELRVLILRSNKLYGSIQGPTPVNSHWSKLQIIDLSNNSFSGQLPKQYFPSWNAMKASYVGKSHAINLQLHFDAGFTLTYPYVMIIITKGVKTEYQKILSIFTAIDLSCNNFEGQIPQAIQDLQGLQSLNLSNNHLRGGVLPSLGSLKNLESLDLSHNELSGEIPQHLLQIGFLAVFNVSFNHLDGRIPQGKQFDTFDNSSYLGNPGLCGEPLSRDCQSSKAPKLPPTSIRSECLLPSDITDWIFIVAGFISGLLIGLLVTGKILYVRYGCWLIDLFGLRND